MERRVFNQMKGVSQTILGYLPAFRQIRDRLPLIVELHQRYEKLTSGKHMLDARLDRRIQMPRKTIMDNLKVTAAFWGVRVTKVNCHEHHDD
jgi:hypothetical protein